MTITDANGNTLKTARNWACKHMKYAICNDVDSVGRITLTYSNGNMAKFFPDDVHCRFMEHVNNLHS